MPFSLRFREKDEHDLRTLALVSAYHPRLGKYSGLNVLDSELLRHITPCWTYPTVKHIYARSSPDGLPAGECVFRSVPKKRSKYHFRLVLKSGIIITEGIVPLDGWLHYTGPERGNGRVVVMFTHFPENVDDEISEEHILIEAWNNGSGIVELLRMPLLKGSMSATLMGVLAVHAFFH